MRVRDVALNCVSNDGTSESDVPSAKVAESTRQSEPVDVSSGARGAVRTECEDAVTWNECRAVSVP